MSATQLNQTFGEIENNLDRIPGNIENSSKLFIQRIEALEKMPMMTRATAAAGTMTESENLNDVEQGRDVQDARMAFTIDSAGRRFNAESAVPIHSCINIATQTGDDDERSNCWWTDCAKKLIMQRLALVVAGILVIVLIILLERTINVDIIDEKKLIQDLAGELLPKMGGGRTTTPSPPSTPANNRMT